MIKRTFFRLFLAIMLVIYAEAVYGQVTQALVDTKRYLPKTHNFSREKGWEITNSQFNMATRSIESQSICGYRFLVDLDSAPRTAVSINAVVTLIRKGQVKDLKTGEEISGSAYAFRKAFNESQLGFSLPARKAPYGDESFSAAKSENLYRILIRRGDFLIDITGSDHLPAYAGKPSLEECCAEMADFIDSRVFGARIDQIRPFQAFRSPSIPLVAGKKTAVYVTVETDRKAPFPAGHILNLSVGKRGFKRESYQIPLNAKIPSEFDPIDDNGDGALWKNETAEPVEIDDLHRTIFRIIEEPDYQVRVYRFLLDPVDAGFHGDYTFSVSVINSETGSKLREKVHRHATGPSGRLKVAIVPVPAGYWSAPHQWKLEERSWILSMKDRGWQNQSFISFYASLAPEIQNRVTARPMNRDYLRKHLPLFSGKIRYLKNAALAGAFIKSIMPLAEENLQIEIFEGFPEDIALEPFPTEPSTILDSLEKWRLRHPAFHRVVGVIPGALPKESGLDFYTDENTGPALWINKKCALIPVDSDPRTFARELLYTFGAVNEWAPPESALKNALNRPTGTNEGTPIIDGFWPQMKTFMGTPIRPINSVMGKVRPSWINGEVYEGIRKRNFSR